MQTEFEMSMIGELSYILGLQVKQSSSLVSTPMVVGCKLSKNDVSPDVDQRTYRSMIGNLMYITTSRLDIMQVVGI
jgi:hypothetical protein